MASEAEDLERLLRALKESAEDIIVMINKAQKKWL